MKSFIRAFYISVPSVMAFMIGGFLFDSMLVGIFCMFLMTVIGFNVTGDDSDKLKKADIQKMLDAMYKPNLLKVNIIYGTAVTEAEIAIIKSYIENHPDMEICQMHATPYLENDRDICVSKVPTDKEMNALIADTMSAPISPYTKYLMHKESTDVP